MAPNNDDFAMIEPAAPTPLEEAAARSELAAKHRGEEPAARGEEDTVLVSSSPGTILEAAFVDPAYQWPPADGQGRNAIELQASLDLVGGSGEDGEEADSVVTTDSQAKRMASPRKPVPRRSLYSILCCRGKDAVVTAEQMRKYEEEKLLAKEARKQHAEMKNKHLRSKERALRRKEKYNRVPEGILIYRLDTSARTLLLMSPPHDKTDTASLVEECVVESAVPGPDKSRRALLVTAEGGRTFTLTACEQRTATAWLEAIGLMHAKHNSKRGLFGGGGKVRASVRSRFCDA